MTMTLDGTNGITFPDNSVQPKASVQPPQSMVRLNTANGYGSTNTVIRRFTNVVTNQGTDITYADSATLGAAFTINVSGVYAISYTEDYAAASNFGISLNSSQLTTAIVSITATDRLQIASTTAADQFTPCCWTGYLVAGAVIRPHTAAAAIGAFPSVVNFTMTRVA